MEEGRLIKGGKGCLLRLDGNGTKSTRTDCMHIEKLSKHMDIEITVLKAENDIYELAIEVGFPCILLFLKKVRAWEGGGVLV